MAPLGVGYAGGGDGGVGWGAHLCVNALRAAAPPLDTATSHVCVDVWCLQAAAEADAAAKHGHAAAALPPRQDIDTCKSTTWVRVAFCTCIARWEGCVSSPPNPTLRRPVCAKARRLLVCFFFSVGVFVNMFFFAAAPGGGDGDFRRRLVAQLHRLCVCAPVRARVPRRHSGML